MLKKELFYSFFVVVLFTITTPGYVTLDRVIALNRCACVYHALERFNVSKAVLVPAHGLLVTHHALFLDNACTLYGPKFVDTC